MVKETEIVSYADSKRSPRYMKGKTTYVEDTIYIIIWLFKKFSGKMHTNVFTVAISESIGM